MRRAQQAAERAGFAMSCTNRTGALLATLAASKPDGRFLELGTGTGVGAAWLLAGMTRHAHLVTVETDPATAAIARKILGGEKRVSLVVADADTWLDNYDGPGVDLVFVDCRPGKSHRRTDLLTHLNLGGMYVGDDLLPQPTWPDDHQPRVDTFLAEIVTQPGLQVTVLNWSSGLVLGTRT
ncbi:MAG: O-methyltransferase [Pseudonocardiaceae bacterium]